MFVQAKVFKIQQNTFNYKGLCSDINPQKTSLTTYVVFPPAFRVAQLNRVGQSDSFTFVTHSTVRRNKGSMLQEGNCFGIQDSAVWLSSKHMLVEPIRDGPFRS